SPRCSAMRRPTSSRAHSSGPSGSTQTTRAGCSARCPRSSSWARTATNTGSSTARAIGRIRAKVAIPDITGVGRVDEAVASGLVKAAQAVELLGAEVVITGVRPEVAQALVQIGVDLSHIVTLGSLQAGIAYAMRKR